MCLNGKYHVVLPPHYAYGEKGVKDYMPGSAVLHIDITPKRTWEQMAKNAVAECDNLDQINFELCDKV